MTFKERFFLGEIPFEDIDRYTSRWNFSDETCTLAAYLGLNGEEEDVWISQSDEALEALLEKEKAAYLACPTKILFTDLDGTLLNNNKEISPANREAIRLAREAGHIIVLTTGRPMASILPLAQDLQLDGPGSYIIGFNGSVVYDCGEQRFLMNRTISLDDVLSVFDAAEKAGIHCQSYEENHVLYLRDDEEGRSYFEHTHTPCQIIAGTDELSKEPNKLLLIDLHNHQKLEDFRAAVEPKFQGRIQFVFSSNTYLEVSPAGTSKGNALHFLCNYLNIPVANTVAAGDSENDLSMIREAAIGAAMANSMVPVKEAADYVTMADNDHDGFAEIIKNCLLK